jgi:hypothetical protein
MTDPIEELEQTTHSINRYMHKHNRTAYGRYPFLFSLLGTFGVVAVLYGLDHILDDIPVMAENPLIPLAIGVLILLFTGSLYKRIEKKFD